MGDINTYKTLLTDLIRTQMVMLGPNVALGTAKKVNGLTIGTDGTVSEIVGEPGAVLEAVVNSYTNLSGQIAQMTFKRILEKYPEVKQPENVK